MDKTLIFGHKKPDTDSVMSAISLSYLKNKLGEKTEAKVLGDINKETTYALEYNKLKKPEYLNDVKLQVKDIKYHKGFVINENSSIYEAYQKMLQEGVTGLPVVKDKDHFTGLATLKDLSHALLDTNQKELFTSYNNLLEILKAEEIVKIDDEITGQLIIASYNSSRLLDSYEFTNDMVLMVGDRHSVIEKVINSKIKLIVLTGNSEIKEEHIKLAETNKVNIIRTAYDTYNVSRLIFLANYVKTMVKATHPIVFEEKDFVTDVHEICTKSKFTNYPIVDKKGKCLGLLRTLNLLEKKPKKVILVDHNEMLQTADGIDEATILEIVDHHNIGSITTSQPINFRNMTVGSSCTIVYTMYKENNIEIPKDIAGALISGILSDTLILKSPTKTEIDEGAVIDLANILGVNYEEYGLELLKAGTSLEGMSKEDVLYNDYKLFKVGDKQFAVGQFFTMNFDEIKKEQEEYIKVLNSVADNNGYQLVALYVTDIIKNGSYVLYNEKAQGIMDLAYFEGVEEGYFVEGCVSRKKNVVPLIMDVVEG